MHPSHIPFGNGQLSVFRTPNVSSTSDQGQLFHRWPYFSLCLIPALFPSTRDVCDINLPVCPCCLSPLPPVLSISVFDVGDSHQQPPLSLSVGRKTAAPPQPGLLRWHLSRLPVSDRVPRPERQKPAPRCEHGQMPAGRLADYFCAPSGRGRNGEQKRR